MAEPKYDDGLYHVEWMEHEYFNGYRQADWTLVNVYGEPCRRNGITIRYGTKEAADRDCAKANVDAAGGLITNFT